MGQGKAERAGMGLEVFHTSGRVRLDSLPSGGSGADDGAAGERTPQLFVKKLGCKSGVKSGV